MGARNLPSFDANQFTVSLSISCYCAETIVALRRALFIATGHLQCKKVASPSFYDVLSSDASTQERDSNYQASPAAHVDILNTSPRRASTVKWRHAAGTKQNVSSAQAFAIARHQRLSRLFARDTQRAFAVACSPAVLFAM